MVRLPERRVGEEGTATQKIGLVFWPELREHGAMNSLVPPADLKSFNRRQILRGFGASTALAVFPELRAATLASGKDSLPMQFYKSLTEEQHAKIVLPVDHPKRQFVSNWWYICPDQRLHT